jgi:hypothetical protein
LRFFSDNSALERRGDMQALYLIFFAAFQLPSAPAVGAPVDSVVIERVEPVAPNRVLLHKRRALGVGPRLDDAVRRLQEAGFFDATPEALALGCGSGSTAGYGVALAVYSGLERHTVVVPDDCAPNSSSLEKTVSALRAVAWAILKQGRVDGLRTDLTSALPARDPWNTALGPILTDE